FPFCHPLVADFFSANDLVVIGFLRRGLFGFCTSHPASAHFMPPSLFVTLDRTCRVPFFALKLFPTKYGWTVESVHCVIPAWSAGIQADTDVSGRILANLDAGYPCQHDELCFFVFCR